MNCPHCGVEMKRRDQRGVEIDYCPECHGIWLDRGELHKIVGQTSSAILEVAKTMAGKLVSLEGEQGRVTVVYSQSVNDEESCK